MVGGFTSSTGRQRETQHLSKSAVLRVLMNMRFTTVEEHHHSFMATVVPCASCYAHSSVQPLHLFGKGPRGDNYLALFTYRGPRCTPKPHLTCHAPKMTLRQICCMLKVMKKVRNREAATAAAAATAR